MTFFNFKKFVNSAFISTIQHLRTFIITLLLETSVRVLHYIDANHIYNRCNRRTNCNSTPMCASAAEVHLILLWLRSVDLWPLKRFQQCPLTWRIAYLHQSVIDVPPYVIWYRLTRDWYKRTDGQCTDGRLTGKNKPHAPYYSSLFTITVARKHNNSTEKNRTT